MAVNRDPILKKCRALDISPAVLGYSEKKKSKRNPDGNKRKKVSEYGSQLKEKQKLKFVYGVLEKQFYHYYELATKEEGIAGENLLRLLESRLDNIVFRMGMATTRREARQLVSHGHFCVNGKRVDIPSYRVKVGDVISLRDKSKKSKKFEEIAEVAGGRLVPMWLDVNKEAATAKVTRAFQREDLDFEIAEHLIIELYSK